MCDVCTLSFLDFFSFFDFFSFLCFFDFLLRFLSSGERDLLFFLKKKTQRKTCPVDNLCMHRNYYLHRNNIILSFI